MIVKQGNVQKAQTVDEEDLVQDNAEMVTKIVREEGTVVTVDHVWNPKIEHGEHRRFYKEHRRFRENNEEFTKNNEDYGRTSKILQRISKISKINEDQRRLIKYFLKIFTNFFN